MQNEIKKYKATITLINNNIKNNIFIKVLLSYDVFYLKIKVKSPRKVKVKVKLAIYFDYPVVIIKLK